MGHAIVLVQVFFLLCGAVNQRKESWIMSAVTEKHYVTFYSPGTLFAEPPKIGDQYPWSAKAGANEIAIHFAKGRRA